MPHSLVGFLSSVNGSSDYANVTPLADAYCAVSGSGVILPRDALLLAAAAGGSGILRAHVQAACLNRLAPPMINPCNAAVTTATGMPRVCDYSRRPPKLNAGESISVGIMNGGAASTFAALIVGYDLQGVPPGEAIPLRYYVTGAAAATANSWSSYLTTDTVALIWEAGLPSGTYAVVGMDHWGATAVMARLILPGYRYRPGVLARTSATGSWNDPLFSDGRIGVLSHWDAMRPQD